MPLDAYRCKCAPGFAGGVCDYAFIQDARLACAIELGGNCDVDVNECASDPCRNGAVCSDSTTDPTISFHAYRCTCMAGFANGLCGYTDFIAEFEAECKVLESSASLDLGGNCDIDVDECASGPCQHGAECTDSRTLNAGVPVDAYACACPAGYTNGACIYDYIVPYTRQCSACTSFVGVAESRYACANFW